MGFLYLIFPAFFPLDREVFLFFCLTLLTVLLSISPVLPRMRLSFLKEPDIESSEYLGINMSEGGASVTPNEALPHIGRQTTA